MWQLVKENPIAVLVAILAHLLLALLFVLKLDDRFKDVGEGAVEPIQAEAIIDPSMLKALAKTQPRVQPAPNPVITEPEPATLPVQELPQDTAAEEEAQARLAAAQARESQRREEERERAAENARQVAEQRAAAMEQEQRTRELQASAEAERRQENANKAAEAERAKEEARKLAEAERRKEEAKKSAAAERIKEEAKKAAEAERKEAAKKAAEAEKKKQDQIKQAEAKKKAEEDKKRKAAEQQRLAAEKAAEQQRMANELAAEESAIQSAAAKRRLAGERNDYILAIKQKVTSKWLRPPGSSASFTCQVKVTQTPGGTVLKVSVVPSGTCDPEVKDSVEKAVWKADPLPKPPSPQVFERNITFIFEP